MKKQILSPLTLLILTSCGHNVGTAFTGKVFNVGYDPELNKFGIQYYDGAMVTGLQKENSKTSFVYSDNVDGDTEDAKKLGTNKKLEYRFENGNQVTGYRVDLEKAKQNGNESSVVVDGGAVTQAVE